MRLFEAEQALKQLYLKMVQEHILKPEKTSKQQEVLPDVPTERESTERQSDNGSHT